ncbi:hypothetical protein JCM8547_008857 [Rhodosporidiobolus lusitaniae]
MLAKSILTYLAVAAPVALATSKVLIPLYSWDEDCWPELLDAAAANPSASFVGIINPDSGPGDSSVDNPSLYCIPYLRQQIPGITLLGYVRTGYGDRAESDVTADIATYQTWTSIDVDTKVAGTAELDGIFFDEAITGFESGDDVSLYETYAESATSSLGEDSIVMFNPGTEAADAMYEAADYVVCYESAYADFAAVTLPTTAAQQAQCMIMLHTFPSDSSTLSSVVNELAPSYGGLWISDVDINVEDIYQNWGSNWDEFVADVAALSTSSSSTGSAVKVAVSSTAVSSAASTSVSIRSAAVSTASSAAAASSTTASATATGRRGQKWRHHGSH